MRHQAESATVVVNPLHIAAGPDLVQDGKVRVSVFGVYGVCGLGFRLWGLGLWGFGALGFGALGLWGFGLWALGFWGFGFGVLGFGTQATDTQYRSNDSYADFGSRA